MTSRDLPDHVRANLRERLREFIHTAAIPAALARRRFEQDVQADIEQINERSDW